jgi:hypothetical protein
MWNESARPSRLGRRCPEFSWGQPRAATTAGNAQVRRWARTRNQEIPTLVPSIYSEIGLTREHVDDVHLWLDLLPSTGNTDPQAAA